MVDFAMNLSAKPVGIEPKLVCVFAYGMQNYKNKVGLFFK
jgi:hypothetical protein